MVTPGIVLAFARATCSNKARGGSASPDTRQYCTNLLATFVRSAMVERIKLTHVHPAIITPSGDVIQNGPCIVMEIDHHGGFESVTALRSWLRARLPPKSTLRQRLPRMPSDMSLTQFVVFLCENQPCNFGASYVTQIAWQVGLAFEKRLGKELRSINDGRDSDFLQLRPAEDLSPYERHRSLMEYVAAGRSTAKAHRNLFSWCLDRRRVGFLSRMSMAFIFPDNVGVWAPPAVRDDSVCGPGRPPNDGPGPEIES